MAMCPDCYDAGVKSYLYWYLDSYVCPKGHKHNRWYGKAKFDSKEKSVQFDKDGGNW